MRKERVRHRTLRPAAQASRGQLSLFAYPALHQNVDTWAGPMHTHKEPCYQARIYFFPEGVRPNDLTEASTLCSDSEQRTFQLPNFDPKRTSTNFKQTSCHILKA